MWLCKEFTVYKIFVYTYTVQLSSDCACGLPSHSSSVGLYTYNCVTLRSQFPIPNVLYVLLYIATRRKINIIETKSNEMPIYPT